MNTLREIGKFVGIPQGSTKVARYYEDRTIRLCSVSVLVTERERPASMRAIIQTLQNLTPITLEAQIVGSLSGEDPFAPVIRVNASGGITWYTTIEYHQLYGNVYYHGLNNSGGDFTPTQLGTGGWKLIVTRAGISNTGFVSLSKTLDTITVTAHPQPPSHQPPPQVKPIIAVQSKGDGSFAVSGSNFLPNAPIYILVGDGTFRNPLVFTDTSNLDGKLVGFPTGIICQGSGQLFFEANDGRLNPSDHSTLMSNTVITSCPF